MNLPLTHTVPQRVRVEKVLAQAQDRRSQGERQVVICRHKQYILIRIRYLRNTKRQDRFESVLEILARILEDLWIFGKVSSAVWRTSETVLLANNHGYTRYKTRLHSTWRKY